MAQSGRKPKTERGVDTPWISAPCVGAGEKEPETPSASTAVCRSFFFYFNPATLMVINEINKQFIYL